MGQVLDFIFQNFFLLLGSLLTIATILVILLENRNPIKASAWVLVVGLLPFLGFFLYLLFGQDQRRKYRIGRRFYDRLMLLPRSLSLEASATPEEGGLSKWQRLIALANYQNKSPLLSVEQIEIFTTGRDMYRQLFDDLRSARDTIHLEAYIFENDRFFEELSELLIEKAKVGVSIRIIYDFIGSYGVPKRKWQHLRSHGIQAYPFLRVYIPLISSTVNYRNHRKITVIDGRVGYMGGMNFATRYAEGSPSLGAWRDTHFRIEGDMVAALQTSFIADWYTVSRKLIAEEGLFNRSKGDKKYFLSQTITGGPWMQLRTIEQLLITMISLASREIKIQTPYFLPTESLSTALINAALSGISVEMIIPDRGDSLVTSLASDSFLEIMLEAGVKIYRYQGGFIHSKLLMVDGEVSAIGSANMDFRSLEHNFEVVSIIYDSAFTRRLEEVFGQDVASSARVELASWQRRPRWQKLKEGFMRLFSPLL